MNRNERGSVGVEMAAVAAFLLIPLTLAVIGATNWIAAHEAASTAAQAAARAAILESDLDQAAQAASTTAQRVVTETGSTFVSAELGGTWGRGETVTVTVTARADPITVPVFGQIGGGFTVTRSSREQIGEWRSIQ